MQTSIWELETPLPLKRQNYSFLVGLSCHVSTSFIHMTCQVSRWRKKTSNRKRSWKGRVGLEDGKGMLCAKTNLGKQVTICIHIHMAKRAKFPRPVHYSTLTSPLSSSLAISLRFCTASRALFYARGSRFINISLLLIL